MDICRFVADVEEVEMSISKIREKTGNSSRKKRGSKDSFLVKDYNRQSSLRGIFAILGGKDVLKRKIETRLDLIEISKTGVSKNACEHLAKYLNYTTKQLADILPITERTIQRHSKNENFNPEVSDHILQIAEVSAKGTQVFNDKSKFISWMNYPCTSFSNRTPVSLLQSKFGVDMVIDELGRIEHGVFS